MNALVSLQAELNEKRVQLRPCDLYSDVHVLIDEPNGNLNVGDVGYPQSVATIGEEVTSTRYNGRSAFGLLAVVTTNLRSVAPRILQRASAAPLACDPPEFCDHPPVPHGSRRAVCATQAAANRPDFPR